MRFLGVLTIVGSVLVACGSESGGKAPGPADDGSPAAQAIRALARVVDSACACTEAPCVEVALAAARTVARQSADVEGTRAQTDELARLGDRLRECAARFPPPPVAVAPPPPEPAPEPPPVDAMAAPVLLPECQARLEVARKLVACRAASRETLESARRVIDDAATAGDQTAVDDDLKRDFAMYCKEGAAALRKIGRLEGCR